MSVDQLYQHARERSEAVTDNKTIAEADSGEVLYVQADAKTITLPATDAGLTVKIVNDMPDGVCAVKIAPNASDKIMGAGFTSADNKYIINTKATAKQGDYIKLVGDGADGWFITEIAGTWAKEA